AAPRPAQRHGPRARGGSAAGRPRGARGVLRRRPAGPHAARVRPARVPRPQSRARAVPRGAAAQGVGLRLRRRDAHGRRARAPPARQAGRAPRPDRDRARRRLQAERAAGGRGPVKFSLRARLLVVPALVVAGAVTLITLCEQQAQCRWLIAHESDALLRLTREAARTAQVAGGSWQAAADSVDARFALRATVIAADGRVLA